MAYLQAQVVAVHPDGAKAVAFRTAHSYRSRAGGVRRGVDTVGALGIPFSVLGFLDGADEFYDTKMGPNVRVARHALAIDERREDFAPTCGGRGRRRPQAGVVQRRAR